MSWIVTLRSTKDHSTIDQWSGADIPPALPRVDEFIQGGDYRYKVCSVVYRQYTSTITLWCKLVRD